MPETIIITGASSHLGQRAIERLRASRRYRIVALGSPHRTAACTNIVPVDLAAALPPEIVADIAGAARILHFAWDRRADATGDNSKNRAMIRALLSAARPGALTFVSSVAGAPDAASAYGRHKHEITEMVLASSGSVLLPGLVVDDPPQGPYAILDRAIARLPVALRLTRGEPNVYPVAMDRLLDFFEAVAAPTLPAGVWRGFDSPVPFNRFLAAIEARHRRGRIPLRLPAPLLLRTARAAKVIPLSTRALCDKALTFLHKNDAFLSLARELPAPHNNRTPKEATG